MPRKKSTHIDDSKAAGARLREARERAGLSQRKLSFPGCSAAYISRVEAGERTPSVRLLRELARRLNVSPDYLATGSAAAGMGRENALLAAEVALRLDDTDLAERLYREVLERPASEEERSRALAGLGQLAFRVGALRRAIEHLEEALADTSLDEQDPASAETLGRAYAMVGENESAIAVFWRALEAAERRGDMVERVRFAVLLSNALVDSGNFGQAEELLGRALALAHGSHDPILNARLHWSQARLHLERNEPHTAVRCARKALALIELTEHTYYLGRAQLLLAQVELDRHRPSEALGLLQKAWPLFEDGANELERALFQLEEARALAALGRREEAAALAMRVSGVISQADPIDAGRGYTILAGIFAELGDRPRARELYELAAELLEGHPCRFLVDVYAGLAELLEAEGRTDEALSVLKKAVGIQSAVGLTPRPRPEA